MQRTGSLVVEVRVTDRNGDVRGASHAVVWLPGVRSAQGEHPPAHIASLDKSFDPHVVAVPPGATVEFPNYDPINHNVFSSSETATFDLGLYRNGASRQHTFRQPGVVPVFCNIHPQMVAYVAVVDSDFFAVTGRSGAVRLDGIPAGTHELRIWEERSRDWRGEVTVVPGDSPSVVAVVLDASSWRDTAHKRKDGTDYPPPDGDENRY